MAFSFFKKKPTEANQATEPSAPAEKDVQQATSEKAAQSAAQAAPTEPAQGQPVATAAPATASTTPAPASAPAAPAAAAKPAGGETGHVRVRFDQRAIYNQLMNSLYDTVLILDDRWHIVDSNKRLEYMFGYSSSDAWDMSISRLIPALSGTAATNLKAALAADDDRHVVIETRCRRKDGTLFPSEIAICHSLLMRGAAFAVTIRSVASRGGKMAEMAAARVAFSVSQEPLFVCQLDGVFTLVNSAFTDMFSISDATQVRSLKLTELLPDAVAILNAAVSGKSGSQELDLAVAPPGGSDHVRLALSPISNGKEVVAIAGSIRMM